MKRVILAILLATACNTLSVPTALAFTQKLSPDTICAAWVVADEARGESLKGQRAVLDVVLKRMEVRKKSACEVVKEPDQFSGYKQGMKIKTSKEVLTQYETVRKMTPVAADCEYFHATYVKPSWRTKMKRVLRVGKHVFYRAKKPKLPKGNKLP